MLSLKRWTLGGGILLVLCLVSWLALSTTQAHVFHGFVMQPPKPAADFTLTAHPEQPVSLRDFRGKVVLLYFGYTACPGVCPTTLVNVAQALRQLDDKASQIQLLMISVDPERDTPERLAAYVQYFHPAFLGLGGSLAEISAVAPQFGIYFEKQAGTEASGYLVDHSATLMVVDQQGVMRLIIPYGTSARDIAADLTYLLRSPRITPTPSGLPRLEQSVAR